MHSRTITLTCCLAVFTILGIAMALAQPTLAPPAGPIEESARFGTRIELNNDTAPSDGLYKHVIVQPGSYYLSGDIDASGFNGILIASSNVTLDLNGYAIVGDDTQLIGSGAPTFDELTDELTGVTVRNGSVRGFERGVRTSFQDFMSGVGIVRRGLAGVLVEELHVEAGTIGMDVAQARIVNCSILAPQTGIEAFASIISGCHIRIEDALNSGSAIGIFAEFCNVYACTVDLSETNAQTRNGYLGNDTLFTECAARTDDTGFFLGANCIANGCLSTSALNFLDSSAQTNLSNF